MRNARQHRDLHRGRVNAFAAPEEPRHRTQSARASRNKSGKWYNIQRCSRGWRSISETAFARNVRPVKPTEARLLGDDDRERLKAGGRAGGEVVFSGDIVARIRLRASIDGEAAEETDPARIRE